VLRRAKKLQKQLDKAQLQLTECRTQIRDLKLQLSDAGDCKVSITPYAFHRIIFITRLKFSSVII